MKNYDYIIVGAGISGCSVAYELNKYTDSILLIDSNQDVGCGASGVAGAFLSPLLGKPNKFKDLVASALKYSTAFYQKNIPKYIDNCGTIRIPKNKEDRKKFQDYIPYMDFKYTANNDGYFFDIGSVVDSYKICKELSEDIEKNLDYKIETIKFQDHIWILNNTYSTNNLILTTGSSINLIDELYFNIRSVWGQRIDIKTSTYTTFNYHKECSVSKSFKQDDGSYKVSIGATHHRNIDYKVIDKDDTKRLLKLADDILELKDIEVIKEVAGSRASSIDYFPIVGELIDSKKTIKEFPYMKNGTQVQRERFTKYKGLFCLNGVGGRGFVLAPYLAKQLVDLIVNNHEVDEYLKADRLFERWIRKI